jgi:hypothetical protein
MCHALEDQSSSEMCLTLQMPLAQRILAVGLNDLQLG